MRLIGIALMSSTPCHRLGDPAHRDGRRRPDARAGKGAHRPAARLVAALVLLTGSAAAPAAPAGGSAQGASSPDRTGAARGQAEEPPKGGTAAKVSPAPPSVEGWRQRPWTLSLEVHGGFFGLLNLDREFTEQDPSFGLNAVAERRVHRLVDVGLEWMFSWMKTVVAPRPRLVMSPQARVRVSFGLGRGFSLQLVLGVGVTLWPADESERAVAPELTATRVGWSLRVGGGAGYALSERWSLLLSVGYYLSSTAGRGVWATLDSLQVSLGARLSL